jgi:hypothetical protein
MDWLFTNFPEQNAIKYSVVFAFHANFLFHLLVIYFCHLNIGFLGGKKELK